MITYVVIAIFVAVMVGVGIASRKKTGSVNEFFLGGRDVGPWLSAFAYGTTYFSAVLFVGYAGKIGFGFGLSSLWIAVGNALVGSLLAWLVLAKPTRLMTARLGVMTVPSFFKERFGSNGLKIAAALVIFIFLVPYSASVYTGLAYLFEEVLGLDFSSGAVGDGDPDRRVPRARRVHRRRAQRPHPGRRHGGRRDPHGRLHRARARGRRALGRHRQAARGRRREATAVWPAWNLSPFSWTAFLSSPAVVLASLVILTSLGVWGLPQMLQKFYAIRDVKVVRPAIWISTIFAALMGVGAYLTGALSRLFPGIPELAAAKQFDQIMPTVLTEALPEALVAVVLLLVLSASMSTLAGLVMISGSAITVDLVQGEIKRDLGEKSAVLLLRGLIIVFVLLSVVLAQQQWQLIVNLMALSWGVVAGCFLGPFVWGLFWRRVSAAAVWVNIAVRARVHGRARLLLRGRQGHRRVRAGPRGADDDRVARHHAAGQPGHAGACGGARRQGLRRRR